MPMDSVEMTMARQEVAEKAFRWWAAMELVQDEQTTERAKEELLKALADAIDLGNWKALINNLQNGRPIHPPL